MTNYALQVGFFVSKTKHSFFEFKKIILIIFNEKAMQQKIFIKFILITLLFLPQIVHSLGGMYYQVDVYTTDSLNPLVIIDKKQLDGISGEFLSLATKNVITNLNLIIMPWARAQIEVNKVKNAIIIPLTRNSDRENNYKWLGKVFDDPICYFTFKPNLEIKSVSDLSKIKKAGMVRNGPANLELLKQNGHVKFVDSNEMNQLVVKLYKKEIDLILAGYSTVAYYWRLNNYDLKELSCYKTKYANQQSVAASLISDQEFVSTMQNAIEEFKKTKEYKNLLLKYHLN